MKFSHSSKKLIWNFLKAKMISPFTSLFQRTNILLTLFLLRNSSIQMKNKKLITLLNQLELRLNGKMNQRMLPSKQSQRNKKTKRLALREQLRSKLKLKVFSIYLKLYKMLKKMKKLKNKWIKTLI